MNILSVAGTALLGCVAALIVKRFDMGAGMLVSLICGVVIFSLCLRTLGSVVSFAEGIGPDGEYGMYFPVMLKGLSVTFLCECAADICRDCGESSVASKVELAGKTELLFLSIPLMKNIIDLSAELMSA